MGGQAVRPERLSVPSLVAIPTRDRIVPPASAAALAARLRGASVLEPEGGHIGMIVAGNARRRLWEPLVAWLRRIAAMQK
jgi:polyhydroxyalkanoate synthase